MHQKTHTVYLIRHGLTYQNLCREYQGSILDYGILPESRCLIEQRQRSGKSPDIRTLWASPLARARRTAELYFPDMSMELIPDLMEREFGDWDGRTHDDLFEEALYRDFIESFGQATPPGGEPYDVFFSRMKRILDRIESTAQASPDSFPLALVFHGGPILHLTDHLLTPDDPFYRFYAPGAGGLRVEIAADPLRIVQVAQLFEDDIPVEQTPFYIDFKR